jgi:hypothetical protein
MALSRVPEASRERRQIEAWPGRVYLEERFIRYLCFGLYRLPWRSNKEGQKKTPGDSMKRLVLQGHSLPICSGSSLACKRFQKACIL